MTLSHTRTYTRTHTHTHDHPGGTLSYQEFRTGLKRSLDIHISLDDWEVITDRGRLTDDEGQFDKVCVSVGVKERG